MIISKTPLRISFFGGGTDYPEWLKNGNKGAVISTTIDRYIHISLKMKPSIFHKRYIISYKNREETNSISNIKHPVVKACLKYFKIPPGCEISYNGDLPARSGVGSSSSFTVGLLNCLYSLKKIKISKKKLAEEAIFIEKKMLKENVGLQDQISCSYGGLNLIKFKKNNFKVSRIKINNHDLDEFNNNLILCYSGIQRISSDIAIKYIKKVLTKSYSEIMSANYDLVKEGISTIKKKNFDEFGKLLNISWELKKKLHTEITNSKLDQFYENAMKSGALGGKLLGAGAGGFFLFYVPKERLSNFIKNNKKQFMTKFKFETYGSTIINNSR